MLKEYRCHICGQVFRDMDGLSGHFSEKHPNDVIPKVISLTVNGKKREILVEHQWTLKRALQFELGLTGAKHMCDKGVCGSCTVIIDGKSALSCMTLAVETEGREIVTIEGIAADPKWKPLVDAYCKWDAMQCGYCTPGFLVTAKAFLDKNPHPTEAEIIDALSGNICICGTYPRHATAIIEAASVMAKGGE